MTDRPVNLDNIFGSEDEDSKSKGSDELFASEHSSELSRQSSYSINPESGLGKTIYTISMIKFFLSSVLKTIIYPFINIDDTGTMEVPEASLTEQTTKMDTEVFNFLRCAEVWDNHQEQGKKIRESYIFCLDEESAFPVYVNIIFGTPQLTSNLLIPAKYLPKSFATGANYFSRKKPIFMEKYGSLSPQNMRLVEKLHVAQVCLSEQGGERMSFTLPLLPSRLFFHQFYADAQQAVGILEKSANSYITGSVRCSSFGSERTHSHRNRSHQSSASRSHLSRASTENTMRTKKLTTDDWRTIVSMQSTIQNERLKKEFIETYAMETYQSRLAYLDSIVSLLKKDAHGLNILCHPLSFKIVIGVLLLFNLFFTIVLLTVIGKDEQLFTERLVCIAMLCTFQACLIFIYLTEFHKTTIENATVKAKGVCRIVEKHSFVKKGIALMRGKPVYLYLLPLIVLSLITDMVEKWNPIPIMFAIGMIYTASCFSVHRESIPWDTVITGYFVQYLFAKLSFNMMHDSFEYFSVKKIQFSQYLSCFLPQTLGKLFSFYPFLPYMIEMAMISSFLIEVMHYCQFFDLIFLAVGYASKMLAITKIEMSYLALCLVMHYKEAISVNSNILRLLTTSERFFVLVAITSASGYYRMIVHQIFGLPFSHSLRFVIITAAGTMATSKLLWPEIEKSRTSDRGLQSTHPSIASFTKLLTDVWINPIATCARFIIVSFAAILGSIMVLELVTNAIIRISSWDFYITFTYILANLFAPLFLLVGADDITQATAIAWIAIRHVTINDLYAVLTFSKLLHQRWTIDCMRSNYDNVTMTPVETPTSNQLRVTSGSTTVTLQAPLVSHRTLFVMFPFITGEHSIGMVIFITANLVSVLPNKLIRSTVNMGVRVGFAGMITKLMTCIVAGLVYREYNKVTCIAQDSKNINKSCELFIIDMIAAYEKADGAQQVCFKQSAGNIM